MEKLFPLLPTLKFLVVFGLILNAVLGMTVTNIEILQSVDRHPKRKQPSHKSAGSKVIGSDDGPVKVYIKLRSKSPRILCATSQLMNMELMDPTFTWKGPKGIDLSNKPNVKITLTGTLIINNFSKELSGVYICTILFYNPSTKALQSLSLKYFLYAYLDPNYTYEFQIQYHAADCHNSYNSLFLKRLHTALNQLVSDLAYTISIHKSECHMLKVPLAGIQYELFLTLKVHLDVEVLDIICERNLEECDHNLRLEKVRHRIEAFFGKQADTYREISGLLPSVYYIDGTLQVIQVDRCKPGYGKDHKKHPQCGECCVVCSPGTYSSGHQVTCSLCADAIHFGESDCETE
ncbi:zona pellucida-binding protein 1-like [Hemiscyllium ocellatum]|uniref:zona pellucida-binding protein 1-like n=1 Tax=Hemiscyllium ocellatum TaxID=170820 RepID=UPI0029674CCE|nr:zona pellucida-binding protein 1-like [Hemiscyllium ocellatum]